MLMEQLMDLPYKVIILVRWRMIIAHYMQVKKIITFENEVVAAQSSRHSQYYQVVGTNPIEAQAGLPALEKQHGKLKTVQNGNTSLAYFSYKQLWRFVFNNDMTPMPSLQKTK